MSKSIALKPRLNEKTYKLSEERVYVFDVATNLNKHSIARAIESQFDVKVISVNTTVLTGKAKRTISLDGKRMVNSNGKRTDVKKAYVTLAKGDALPFFNAIEEADEKQKATQEKINKAAAKAADKESKPARRGLRRTKKEDDK
jgi:large subunit ribosomal protein L23